MDVGGIVAYNHLLYPAISLDKESQSFILLSEIESSEFLFTKGVLISLTDKRIFSRASRGVAQSEECH
jgi:hypothetical protein